ncbi:MAG: ABC transporter ATP-binding protein, partial [Firmicutes bacterium]|nr:ABC transporter ATP-binding protein [Bacillota bacterium]
MKEKRRSGPTIMMRLIGLVKPLWPVMALAIILGVAGYLCAIFLTILAGCCIAAGLGMSGDLAGMAGAAAALNTGTILISLAVLAVMRGLLHYGEQYCNHFIAFKLLAIIRHKVFAALRRLAPAKLEGRDRGNLIAVITSDIELLEVFYAHTISPIAIGAIVSIIMTVFIWQQSALAGIIAAAAYVTVGLIIPVIMGRNSGGDGLKYRNAFGELNSYVLESLRGLDESIQYGSGEARLDSITGMSTGLAEKQRPLNRLEQSQRSVTNLAVIGFSMIMLFEMTGICKSGDVTFAQALICTIAMLGSFGPVIALSNLTNNLQQTFASGNRVLDILDGEPETAEVAEGKSPEFDGAALENVTFAYDSEVILDDYILEISKGKITGIHGASGSGKSTMLKLLMRFWDPDKGTVRISGEDIRTIR